MSNTSLIQENFYICLNGLMSIVPNRIFGIMLQVEHYKEYLTHIYGN